MKIVLSSAGFFPHLIGGGQTYVAGVGRELLRRGHDLTVLTSVPWNGGKKESRLKEYYEWDALPVFGVSVNPELVTDADKSSELSPITIRVLKEALAALKPDLLHLNGMKPPLIRLSNELCIPHVLTAHHPGVACPTALLLRPDLSMCTLSSTFRSCVKCCAVWRTRTEEMPPWIGRMLGCIPRSVGRMAHRISPVSDGPWFLRVLRYPWKIENIMAADRVILRESRLVVSPSGSMGELLVRNGVPKGRIVNLAHGIEPLPPRPLELLPKHFVRFGYVGNYGMAKGVHVLVEALGRLRPTNVCEVHLFGGNLDDSSAVSLRQALGGFNNVFRVIDHGPIPYERITEVYEAIDVLVLPSISFEVFGLVVLEAFSSGRPVIVSRCGGPEELVRNGVDGFVVERNDPQALAEAMQRFIDDPGLVVKMAANIGPVKTMSQYVDELEVVYNRAISGYSPGV